VFSPEEYLSRDERRANGIPAGTTIAALLAVVDPGPDAYGFELDICAPGVDGAQHCANDHLFR
jgi:hypothetical protein